MSDRKAKKPAAREGDEAPPVPEAAPATEPAEAPKPAEAPRMLTLQEANAAAKRSRLAREAEQEAILEANPAARAMVADAEKRARAAAAAATSAAMARNIRETGGAGGAPGG